MPSARCGPTRPQRAGRSGSRARNRSRKPPSGAALLTSGLLLVAAGGAQVPARWAMKVDAMVGRRQE